MDGTYLRGDLCFIAEWFSIQSSGVVAIFIGGKHIHVRLIAVTPQGLGTLARVLSLTNHSNWYATMSNIKTS